MSHIDDLIATLAPEGVEFKPVGEITTKSSNIKWGSSGDDEFQYIDLSSVDRVTRRIGGTATVTAVNAPSRAKQIVHTGDVIFATTRPAQMRWAVITAEYDGQIASTGYCVLRPDTSVVLTNFLAHILGSDIFRQYVEENQVAGNYPSIPDNRVRAYRIPVPPLEVQREIVRILDQFTALEAELEAELEARRHQYEYYRDEALRFGDDVRSVPLGDVIHKLRTGLNPRQNFKLNTPGATNHYITVRELAGFNILPTDKTDLVDDQGLVRIQDRSRLQVGDVLFSGTGTIGRTALVKKEPTSWNIKEGIYALTPKRDLISSRFLIHLLRSSVIRQRILGTADGSTVASVSMASLRRVLLPVPSMDEQERITALLDNFETLTNDLSIGLPAELAARRKQYEYYRDKLLTFEEAPA